MLEEYREESFLVVYFINEDIENRLIDARNV
jgi:hypothetical protein